MITFRPLRKQDLRAFRLAPLPPLVDLLGLLGRLRILRRSIETTEEGQQGFDAAAARRKGSAGASDSCSNFRSCAATCAYPASGSKEQQQPSGSSASTTPRASVIQPQCCKDRHSALPLGPPPGQFEGLGQPDIRHLAPPRPAPMAKDIGGRPEPKGKGKSKGKDKGKGKGKDDADGRRSRIGREPPGHLECKLALLQLLMNLMV